MAPVTEHSEEKRGRRADASFVLRADDRDYVRRLIMTVLVAAVVAAIWLLSDLLLLLFAAILLALLLRSMLGRVLEGIRINEGGDGSLVARIRGTRVVGNGGDGIGLDERGLGNADFRLEDSKLVQNGSFDPSDYDDGIDVDESGAGDVLGQVVNAEASGNYEQGFDLNENDAGNMDVTMQGVVANDNAEEGIEFRVFGDTRIESFERIDFRLEVARRGERIGRRGIERARFKAKRLFHRARRGRLRGRWWRLLLLACEYKKADH